MSATTILDRIVARHRAEFESQCAYMQTTAFLDRIALMQKVHDTLVADGFGAWPQVCWSICNYDSYPPGIHLHVDINEDHKRDGMRRLYEILPRLIPGDNIYTEGGHTIEISPHATNTRAGWKPAELREAPADGDHGREGGAA